MNEKIDNRGKMPARFCYLFLQ